MKNQHGMSAIRILFWFLVTVFIIMFFAKLIPVADEYIEVRHMLKTISSMSCVNDQDFRSVHTVLVNQSDISGISSLKIGDVKISKNQTNGTCDIKADYERKVPLFANVGLYLDFSFNEVGK